MIPGIRYQSRKKFSLFTHLASPKRTRERSNEGTKPAATAAALAFRGGDVFPVFWKTDHRNSTVSTLRPEQSKCNELHRWFTRTQGRQSHIRPVSDSRRRRVCSRSGTEVQQRSEPSKEGVSCRLSVQFFSYKEVKRYNYQTCSVAHHFMTASRNRCFIQ